MYYGFPPPKKLSLLHYRAPPDPMPPLDKSPSPLGGRAAAAAASAALAAARRVAAVHSATGAARMQQRG